MSRKDDIYKKEAIPRFARSKYRKSLRRSGDSRFEAVSGSKHPAPVGGSGGLGGGSRFQGRIQGQSRSRSGRQGVTSRGRRSRSLESNKSNLVIIGILLFALTSYVAILGYVKMKANARIFPVAKEGEAGGGQSAEVVANQNPAVTTASNTEGPAGVSLQTDKPVAQLISDLQKAYSEIKAVDTPLNTASPEQTIARLEKQLAVTPNLIDLKTELARRYKTNGQYDEAAQQLSSILSAEPHNQTARDLLAETYMEGMDYTNAIVVANWILEEDKFSTQARNILATCYMKTGDYPMAISHLRALANENSLDVVTQNNLGVAHSKMQRYDLAIPIFEKTIRIDKTNALGYFNLAICHAQMDQDQKACDVIYQASDQFGPSFVGQWLNSKQFAPIAGSVSFKRLKARFAVYTSNPDDAANLMKSGIEAPEAVKGKAALPEFKIDE